ncbi:replication-relaxation family protein [Amycolatopsis sp. cmx-4-68]|uniref:replication-relaxation family protein n=1 Tax=Amycolatopsis sp. cmx-4-68 TaxID=2790938 RepID=UPI00397A955D
MSRAVAGLVAPVRVRQAFVTSVAGRLTERDWQVVGAVARLRVASGQQLERLCFVGVREGRSRTVTRSRVLARLVRWQVLVPLGRRVGGPGRGSTAQLYTLDNVGKRLVAGRELAEGKPARVRRPEVPGVRTLRHMTGVSELYVALVELAREQSFGVAEFAVEPRRPDGRGGWLKPDAYVVLARRGVRDSWWVEHDEATESLPTIRRKLEAYVRFWQSGQRGPDGVMPRVLVSTVTEARKRAIEREVVDRLSSAAEVVTVTTHKAAVVQMYEVLRE